MLRKINACSNLIFQKNNDILHHSIETDIEGNIWVPSTIYPQILKEKVGNELNADGGYADDGIVKLSPDGEVLFEKSVSQIFIDNGLEYLLFSVGDMQFTTDPIHLNDIQPIDFDGEFCFNEAFLGHSIRRYFGLSSGICALCACSTNWLGRKHAASCPRYCSKH